MPVTQEIQFAVAASAVLSVGAAWLSYKWLRKGSQGEMFRHFETLLEEGQDGSVVAISAPHSGLSLRFFKRDTGEKDEHLELMLEFASWSDTQRERLEAALKEKGFKFRKRRRPGRDDSFMIVEVCPDCETAVDLARVVLEDGFGLSPDEQVEVTPILEGLRTTTVSFAERPKGVAPRQVSLSDASWT